MLDLSVLSSRDGFNLIAKDVDAVFQTIDAMQKKPKTPLASLLRDFDGALSDAAQLVILSLVSEKFGYHALSFNISKSYPEIGKIRATLNEIQTFDLVFTLHHPLSGLCILGQEGETSVHLQQGRLVVIYARSLETDKSEEERKKTAYQLLHQIKDFITKQKTFDTGLYASPVFKKPVTVDLPPRKAESAPAAVEPRAASQASHASHSQAAHQNSYYGAAAAKEVKPTVVAAQTNEEEVAAPASNEPAGAKKTSPAYAVQVTNELFHNGNVEAWKNIIESYNLKYPDIEIFVYHKEERILNLNSLFKWGKVKNGDSIVFRVKAVEFKDLARLKRYLFEGASNRFEKFLHKELNGYLKLF